MMNEVSFRRSFDQISLMCMGSDNVANLGGQATLFGQGDSAKGMSEISTIFTLHHPAVNLLILKQFSNICQDSTGNQNIEINRQIIAKKLISLHAGIPGNVYYCSFMGHEGHL